MASNGNHPPARVLLPPSKPRLGGLSHQSSWKPVLLGAVLGALVVHTLLTFSLTTGHRSDRLSQFADGGTYTETETYGYGNVRPNSNTVRNEDGVPCDACESAIALKEVELGRLRSRVSECTAENLKLLEAADFGGDTGNTENTEDTEDMREELTTSAMRPTKTQPTKRQKRNIEVFVGIQTGYSPEAPPGDDYNYEDRRKAIRETWFRSGDPVYVKKLEEAGIVAKFVIGSGKTAQMKGTLLEENRRYNDFLVLPIEEDYHNLVNKTREFFRAVMEAYEPKYIVKVDDDVYLKLTRLPAVVKQWEERRVDYTGCMKRGPVYKDPKYKWYEPQHGLLGEEYFSHCWGSLYVLSRKAAASMLAVPEDILRSFENEDVTIGTFMLAANLQHYDDRRLCASTCDGGGVGLYDVPTPGLNPVISRMHELHESDACRMDEDRFDVTVPLWLSAIQFSSISHD